MKYQICIFMYNLKNIITAVFITLITGIVNYSCSNTCTSPVTEARTVKLGFYKVKNKSIVDTTIKNVFISIRYDTMLYNGKEPAQIVSLELDQNNDSSVFYFKTDSINSITTDTLIFGYKHDIQLISSDCGFNSVFSALQFKKYTRNIIDTVIAVTTDVNSDVRTNYKLILKVKPKTKSGLINENPK
jgi:hypothetical protein